jgi:predicted membrane protein
MRPLSGSDRVTVAFVLCVFMAFVLFFDPSRHAIGLYKRR